MPARIEPFVNELNRRFQLFRKTPAFTGFVLFCAILVLNIIVQGPASFFSMRNLNTLFSKNTPFILVTLAQSVLLIAGSLNIAAGTKIALVNVIAIMGHEALGLPLPAAWLLGLAAAVVMSAFTGVCISGFGLPGMLAGYAAILMLKGMSVLIMPVPQGTVPREIYRTYDSIVLGIIPFSALVIAIIFGIWMIIKKTRFGKHIYAVGANPRNAYAAGINPFKTQMLAFIISGVIIGFAGLALTGMTASGNPLQAEDYGIRSLAACIIGGLGFGGWGSLACGLFGAGFMVLINNTVYFIFTLLYNWIPGFTVSSYWQNFVSDLIILLSLLMTIVTARGQREALRQGVRQLAKGGRDLGKQQ